MTFPEVASVWGKAGRANTATDWAPMSMVETVVNLKPESEWRRGMTQDRLIAEMDQRLRLTGAVNTWTMPIKNRTDMLSTGVRTTLAVKIFGPDLQTIQRIGQDIERALAPVPGTASVYAERSFGGRYLDIRPDADALARYGLTTGDAQEVISLALGGEEITTTVEGRERYPVQVRYARDFRDDPTTISRLLVGSGDGPQVPLGQVADIQFSPGPPMIRSEGGYLYDQVSIDVRGRDVGSYVRDAQAVVAREVKLPTGYWLRWSGQYEAIQRVKARLQVVVPLTLGIIALLLYLTFGTVAETAIVMLSLPFALVGGRDDVHRGADGGRDVDVHHTHVDCHPGDLLLVAARARGGGTVIDSALDTRAVLLGRGAALEVLTVGYNAVEGLVAIGAGLVAGSVALTGFGIDSVIEVASGVVLWWRLRAELGAARVGPIVEARAARWAGVLLLALAVYIVAESGRRLFTGDRPGESVV